jgi:hypothetical protein
MCLHHHDPDTTLYVITPISNAAEFKSRYKLYHEFANRVKHVKNIVHITIELAIGKQKYNVTKWWNRHHIQLRTNRILWHKENLINIAIERLPKDWKYVAWVDADVYFTNQQWPTDTIQQLQSYDVVQLFTHSIDLGPIGQPIGTHEGFGRTYHHYLSGTVPRVQDPYAMPFHHPGKNWHPGFGWAMTRQFYERIGGLMERAIVGSADYHMACAFIGEAKEAFKLETIHKTEANHYHDYVLDWEAHFRDKPVNVGYVRGTVMHYWHGAKQDRGYLDRRQILSKHDFHPILDLNKRSDGLLEFAGNKPEFEKDMRNYFFSRKEDDNVVKEWKKK